MTRTLLVAALASVAIGASAQCVPNALYADSVYGVWPDTTENFASGMVNVFYSDTMNLLIPSDASLIDPSLPVTIDSVRMDQITGLPPGITVACNSQTGAPCTYLPNQVGCGLLEGIPTEAGTFDLVIEVTAYFQLFFTTQSSAQTFGGYSITIAPNTVGIGDLAVVKVDKVKNVPNPFANRTSIEFNLPKPSKATVKVFNLVGEQLWKETIQAKAGVNHVPFEASMLENGIYLYHVEAAGSTWTGRMMVNR